jgi:hypothetical protein
MSSPPAHGSGSEGAQEEHAHDALYLALQVASESGNLAEVLAQLEAGADVNRVGGNSFGRSPLRLASWYGHIACLRALLAAGAEIDKDIQTDSLAGFTALSAAVLDGQTDVVRCLLEAGASQANVGLEDIYIGRYGMGGFNLQVLQLLRAYAPARNVVLGLALQAVFGCQAFLDATSRWTSQLHYFQFLPAERVAGLLADGADVHASDGSTDAPTPIGQARALLQTGDTDARTELIVSADPLPSSEGTHALFPPREGARAVELLLAGHLLAHSSQRFAGQETALLDVWVAHVMPLAVQR